ncbi:MAG: hypothetical protein IKH15_08065 [Bacteroidales bacterium]|nr:hypothetical protein [Bacteroidales bacterium]MBR4637040.1 hypothetical protein [Bacteroidales bacterium]
MAQIISTSVQVYSGTTATTQVGQTITVQGSPASVALDVSTLGVALSPGSQYCTRAQCSNDEQYTTPWTAPYPFKTLILAEFSEITGGCGNISPEMLFTYDSSVLSVSECGIYVSTNASGSNPTKIAASDEQQAGQGWEIDTLNENTTYYCIPFVTDSDGRTYMAPWSDAESVNTSYRAPVISIANVATTYNSVSANASISTNDTLQGARVTLQAVGGGPVYTKNLTASTGTQNFTFTDGETDAGGQTVSVQPNMQYRLVVYGQNTSGCSGSGTGTATTPPQAEASIAITSVTNITPVSAQVNLSYGIVSGD